jgi:hypothetical protein
MIDTKLSVSSVPSGGRERITNLSIERCVGAISEPMDWKIYLGLGENFRRSVANLFHQILEQQLQESGEDAIFFAEGTEQSANFLAFSFTHRLILKINEEIENHFRAGYATMTENIIAEYLPVAMSQFLSELELKKLLPFAEAS